MIGPIDMRTGQAQAIDLSKYNEDQPRDDHGRFGEGSGGSSMSADQHQAAANWHAKQSQQIEDRQRRGSGLSHKEKTTMDAHDKASALHARAASAARNGQPLVAASYERAAAEHAASTGIARAPGVK
jgi:hypothetical protein